MKNPYRTKEYKDKFTYQQALQLMKSLASIRVISNITFGSNTDIEQALLDSESIPFHLLASAHKRLREGTKEQFEYNSGFDPNGILLDKQGTYLYNKYDDYDEYFEPPCTPIYLAIDSNTKEFMFQYDFNVCIFGDTTGKLYYIRMD